MAWKVKSYLSTRKTGKVTDEEFIDWAPGDIVDAFPEWCPVDEWETNLHIEKTQQSPKPKATEGKDEDEPSKFRVVKKDVVEDARDRN